jgi:hypothetical protein
MVTKLGSGPKVAVGEWAARFEKEALRICATEAQRRARTALRLEPPHATESIMAAAEEIIFKTQSHNG